MISETDFPSIDALSRSGYIVGLWFPHMVIPFISSMDRLVLIETWAFALFASNAVIAIHNCELLFELDFPISAFVFAGFPTTRIFASSFPLVPMAFP